MPDIIIVSEEETGTNADMLGGTRLESIPQDGEITLEIEAADCIAANKYAVTLQIGATVPMDGVLAPGGKTAGVTGQLDDATALILTLPVRKADKVLLSCVETGDTELMWRVTYRSAF